MKKRLIVSAVGVPILVVVLILAPEQLLAIFLAAMCVIAMYEALHVTGIVKNRVILAASMAYGGLIPFWTCYGRSYALLVILTLVFLALLMAVMMASKGAVRLEQVSGAFLAAFFIPLFLSTLLVLMEAENGRYLLFFPFVIAFTTDTGAYFVGKLTGRRKLAPALSPNKTVEGSVGGIFACVIAMLIYGLLMILVFRLYLNMGSMVLCAVLGAAAGEFGDLVFSAVKRQAGIKDYGNIMPGHGGILDRFDSVIFVAPLVTAFMYLYFPFA